ncbi:MAG: CotH kinase family protein [Bacteroidales bacterium]|nr:CotH kinase family protein [Bacteroidales bacterium]
MMINNGILKYALALLAIFAGTFLNAQAHWETVVMANDIWAYFIGDTEPPAGWYTEDFNDTEWIQARGSFGFGDNDDTTILNITYSLYIRTVFQIFNTAEIDSVILDIDYDDAYVAYLNGQVIARSYNIETDYPAYNYTPTGWHEAVMFTGGQPERVGIPRSVIKEGDNTLAIQGINMEPTSTDFSLAPFLHIRRDGAGILYSEVPQWFVEPDPEFESNLPIMVIETEGGGSITDEPKINAHMGIIYNGPGERNHQNDPYNEYNGSIGIELRGHSTSDFPKKPYNFETRDDLGENLDVSLLGMPEENDWVLRASYIDHTFIRNPLSGHMSRQTGRWASNTRHVELILNGEYQGIYILMEKLKRDKNRVDIATLDSTEISGEDITGGYIWEITGFEEHFGERRTIAYPKIKDIHPLQLAYIKSVDDAFRNKMRVEYDIYANPDTGYVAHIDVASFIYEAIVQEAMRNSDAYGWSGYYHKDKNGPINAGPVWDFDQSAGNSSFPDDGIIDLWLYEHPGKGGNPFYWPLLFNEPFFRYSVSLRWKELRAGPFRTETLLAYVDSIADLLSEAEAREFEKWPVLGKYIWRETIGYQDRDTYRREVGYLKNFLTQRWAWMDQQLSDVPKPPGYPEITILKTIGDRSAYFEEEKVYLDLDSIFSYPFAPDLKFSAISSDTSVVEPDVKKSDSLKLELKGIGVSELFVTATDIYGNRKSIRFNFEVLESIIESAGSNLDKAGTFMVYPNPASGQIHIRTDIRSPFMSIELYNLVGQRIDHIYSGPGRISVTYDCGELENGIYLVMLRTDRNYVLTRKLVINR